MDDRFRRDQTASNDCQVESQLIQENSVWYRATSTRYLPAALSSTHTAVARSRFNAGLLLLPVKQFESLYFAGDYQTALFEARAMLGDPAIPGGAVSNPTFTPDFKCDSCASRSRRPLHCGGSGFSRHYGSGTNGRLGRLSIANPIYARLGTDRCRSNPGTRGSVVSNWR